MKFQNLSLYYRLPNQKKKYILNRLNYQFPDLGMVVITGDSGIGKSSLLKVIAKLIQPQRGRVILPASAKSMPPVYLSDQLALIPQWKVRDYLHQEIQQAQFKDLGFTDDALDKTYHQLSIGQQVRLKIIIFLHQPASAYLLDEPTHALDELNRNKLIEYLKVQAQQKLILIATHDQHLIENSHIEMHLHSSFQTSVKHHQKNSIAITNPLMNQKKDNLNIWKRWFCILEKLNRSTLISKIFMFAISMIQIAIFLLTAFTFQLQDQATQFGQQIQEDPWLEVVEIEQTPIHDSPFQLVRTTYPNHESFQGLFEASLPPLWLTDISEWFPKTIIINQVQVTIRFVDLPFDHQHLSAAWIYPHLTLPKTLTLSTLTLPNLSNPLTFLGPINPLFQRMPLTWFEPPQLLLSYWQWLSILTYQTIWIENTPKSYLEVYSNLLPPSHALMYIPDPIHRVQLKKLSSENWRLTSPTEKTYPLITPVLKPLLSFFPIMIIILILIWVLLVWSRLHWIYQRYDRHWQWMIALHQSFEKIWFHLTLKGELNSTLLHGATLSILGIMTAFQRLIAMPSIWVLLFLQIIVWVALEMLKLFLKKIFHYA